MEQERYLEVIEEALLAFGSDAAMLSALDVQVVLGWQQAGIPLAIALKGLRQGVHVFESTRKAEDPFPRRVAYFSTWVQRMFQRYRARVFVPTPTGAPSASTLPATPRPSAGPATFDALQAELTRLRATDCALISESLARLEAEIRERAAELSADLDLPLAWALEANARLADAALSQLPPDARSSLQRTAEATTRTLLPLAGPEALAARARLEVRRLLTLHQSVPFFDLRELSR
jgi:hypothetical protein